MKFIIYTVFIISIFLIQNAAANSAGSTLSKLNPLKFMKSISHNFLSRNKTLVNNGYSQEYEQTHFLLYDQNHFAPKRYITSKIFGKLPKETDLMTPLEKEIKEEMDIYLGLKNNDNLLYKKKKLDIFPGEFKSLYESLVNKEIFVSNTTAYQIKNAINDKIFGRIKPFTLGTRNQLQSKLLKEYTCKQALLYKQLIKPSKLKYIHIGDFCFKTVIILKAIEDNASPFTVERNLRLSIDIDDQINKMYKKYIF